MDLDRYIGKRFTLLLTDEKGEVVAYGDWIASLSGGTLLLDRPGGHMELLPNWVERIEPVLNDEIREILLDADFFIRMNVGPKPNEGSGDMPTGMRWPG